MVNQEKIKIGHKAVKQLPGGIHDNLAMLRKAINNLYEKLGEEKPQELVDLNDLFNNE